MKKFLALVTIATFVFVTGAYVFTPVAKSDVTKWEYMSKRMKAPKTNKWIERWNDLGAEGWELADRVEHYYIFKRQVSRYSSPVITPVEPTAPEVKSEEPVATPEKETPEKVAPKKVSKARKHR